jgi:hypothetical protein
MNSFVYYCLSLDRYYFRHSVAEVYGLCHCREPSSGRSCRFSTELSPRFDCLSFLHQSPKHSSSPQSFRGRHHCLVGYLIPPRSLAVQHCQRIASQWTSKQSQRPAQHPALNCSFIYFLYDILFESPPYL